MEKNIQIIGNRIKLLGLVLVLVMLVPALAGCGENKIEVKEIDDHFYEVGTYNYLDYEYVNDYFREMNDNWEVGCSAISADIGGERLVGRNMDLNISNKCAYFVRTKVEGRYETIGLAYTFRDVSPDRDVLEKEGLGETFEKILPFMCDDVINSEGLHVEINMRHGESTLTGEDIFGVEGTNPEAPDRVYVFTLCQYIALNCKDIPEVKKKLAEWVDVYSKKDYWNYSFLITEAGGDSVLLEFGNGRYYWTEPDENGVVAQTNFYVNEVCNKLEDIRTGIGRYDTLMDGIGDVKNREDLFNLMKKIQYSSFYLPYAECKSEHFDPRSEVIGEQEGLTYDFCMSPENEDYVETALDAVNEPYRAMSRQEKMDLNSLWESTFTEVVSPKEKTIFLRLFENDKMLYRISFDGVEKIEAIK